MSPSLKEGSLPLSCQGFLNLYNWAPNKGKFKHRKNTMEVGEHHVKINAEIRAILLQTEKCQKFAANLQQLGRGMEQILS